MFDVVERPVAARHSKDDFKLDARMDQCLFKNPHAIAVAEVVRVLGLVAVEVEIADAHADKFHVVLVGKRVG